LTPQGGGSPVTVFTAGATPPFVNLEQLDQVSEILGNVSVPAGTYTGATLSHSRNAREVQIVVGAGPAAGRLGDHGGPNSVEPDPDSGDAGQRGQPDCTGEGQLRLTAGGDSRAEQCTRSGIRSQPSGVHRCSQSTERNGYHAICGQFQWPSATSSDGEPEP